MAQIKYNLGNVKNEINYSINLQKYHFVLKLTNLLRK